MENLVFPRDLPTQLENFRKILQFKRDDLTSLALSHLSFAFLQYLKEERNLNELSLEFILRLSLALYIKSKLLLNTLEEPNYFEEETEELETFAEKKKIFSHYHVLLGRGLLEEDVFLPKINGVVEIGVFEQEKGDFNLFLSALLSFLEKQLRQAPLTIEWHEKSIEEYMEEVRDILRKKKIITWKELIEDKEIVEVKEKIYYFLSLLFLVFYGECGIYQDDFGCIQVFLKSTE
ncbi:MAG: hypothetical protein ACK4K4_00955 [Caldimicrobium sp.]